MSFKTKRLLLLPFLLGFIHSAEARVVYIVNFGRINIEERCTDGKADHQIWYMDLRGKRKILNLKGKGNKYFKYPELIPSGERYGGSDYECSQRQLTRKEIEAYQKMFIDACEREKPDKRCIKWD